MRKISGLIRLMRPVNCSMMGLAVIVGAIISTQEFTVVNDAFSRLMLGFITAFTLTAASMAINDYYDRDIDAINEPDRPIPSGLIKPMESLSFATALTVIGLASAAFTSVPCLLTAVASWVISAAYSTIGKRTGLPGNFLVSTCISVPFIYGSLALKGSIELNVIFFAALAFLANTGREIAKGIADVEGDGIRRIRTLAISYGARAAAYTSSAFFILAVLLSPIPALLGLMSMWFLPPLILADIGFTLSSLSLIKKHTRENAKRIKKITLIWMMLSLIAFMAGTIK
jgi:geranylgeranylglycerol-phosphate geranylgeranyltransferase